MDNRLRVLRAERNWSQQDLAQRLDVSRQSVNAIETGKYDPSLPLAFRIAELFDLAIEEIFLLRRATAPRPSDSDVPPIVRRDFSFLANCTASFANSSSAPFAGVALAC